MERPRRGRPPNALKPDDSSAARLGAEIRGRRHARGLTLEALAKRIGFSPQHLSEVERAKAPVSRPFVAACDRALEARGALMDLLPAVVFERAAERHDRSATRRRARASSRGDSPERSATPAAATTQDVSWRASAETAADLETLVGSYRRAYAGRSTVADLLPSITGVMHLLIDLGRRDQWPGPQARLASLVGQAALLTGLLQLMGPRDLQAAKAHYDLALASAREAEDWDLAAYVLGSLAYQAHSARRPADAQAIARAAWDLASRRARPRTRAWAAALGSEIHASAGDELSSGRLLDEAFGAIERTREEPSWQGIGWFDKTRLLAYHGGNLLIQGKHAEADDLLRRSLNRLDPGRLKHRCTTSADLAMSLAHRGEVDESCAYAVHALNLATSISHRESVDRVRRVHFRLLRWRTHPAVQQLTEQLKAA